MTKSSSSYIIIFVLVLWGILLAVLFRFVVKNDKCIIIDTQL